MLDRNNGLGYAGPRVIGYECQGETNEEFWKKHGRPTDGYTQQDEKRNRERGRDFESPLLSV
jgi:hypothetical protein